MKLKEKLDEVFFFELFSIGNRKTEKSTIYIWRENNTWARGDMEFIFECSHRYGTSERSERVRYRM